MFVATGRERRGVFLARRVSLWVSHHSFKQMSVSMQSCRGMLIEKLSTSATSCSLHQRRGREVGTSIEVPRLAPRFQYKYSASRLIVIHWKTYTRKPVSCDRQKIRTNISPISRNLQSWSKEAVSAATGPTSMKASR